MGRYIFVFDNWKWGRAHLHKRAGGGWTMGLTLCGKTLKNATWNGNANHPLTTVCVDCLEALRGA